MFKNSENSKLSNKPKVSLKEKIITQAIAIFFFVFLPILITWMAPFTDLEIRYKEQGTEVKIRRYILFFLPWKEEELLNVKSIKTDITAEKYYADTSENRRKGNVGVSLATAQLIFINDGPEVRVQVDPELAESTEEIFNELVLSKNSEPLKISLYASWALSYTLGGVATFFCALYVFGSIITILSLPFKIKNTK